MKAQIETYKGWNICGEIDTERERPKVIKWSADKPGNITKIEAVTVKELRQLIDQLEAAEREA